MSQKSAGGSASASKANLEMERLADYLINSGRGGSLPPPPTAPRDFHRRLPGYVTTELVDGRPLADALGLGGLWIKDESRRFGLPSFKILGASWAIYCALMDRLRDEASWEDLGELRRVLTPIGGLTLVAATDGNHGRAVARMASLLGFASLILVPRGMAQARIDAIRSEGATVRIVDGTYDDAVEQSAALGDEAHLVISDTSWDGYDEIPRRVIEGYSTIFSEIDEQLAGLGEQGPDLIVVQVGVGALGAATAAYAHRAGASLAAVEPIGADCVLQSVRTGRPVRLADPHHSIMAGLNCGAASPLALPILETAVDAFLVIDDAATRRAMSEMADLGLVSGESGAAGLAGLTAALSGPDELRRALNLDSHARVLVLSTEGATDPLTYREAIGRGRSAALLASLPPDLVDGG